MATLTEVANLALAMVSDDRITRLDTDTSRPARLCNEMLPQVYAEATAEHPWNFAIARARLPALAAAPSWCYARAFQIPPDCLRVLELDTQDPHEPWQREGDTIVTNATAPLYIRYIRTISDTGRWSPKFVYLVATMLAARLAVPLTNSASLAAQLMQDAEIIARRARATDAAEGTPHPQYTPSDVLLNARL